MTGASILILGIGNLLMGDDGVGVHAVQRILAEGPPAGVEVLDGGTAGLDLVDVLAGRRRVVVLDAIQAEAPPGTLLSLDRSGLEAGEGPALSLHQAGLLAALRAGDLLGTSPAEVVVLGLTPRWIGLGLSLSPPVAAALPGLVAAALTEARDAGSR